VNSIVIDSVANLGSDFSFPDLGSRVDKTPDPHQRILVFFTQKTDAKFSKIRSRMFIPDPIFGFFHPGSIGQKTPDPGSATVIIEVWDMLKTLLVIIPFLL
jgi:hypothetical protein